MHFTCKYITLYFTLGNYTFRSCIWNLISLKWLMSYLSNGLCGCNNKIEAGLKRVVDYFSPCLLSVSSLSQWCHFWLQFSKTERCVNWRLSVQHIPDQLVFIYLFFKHKFLIKTEKVTSINTFFCQETKPSISDFLSIKSVGLFSLLFSHIKHGYFFEHMTPLLTMYLFLYMDASLIINKSQ